MPDTDAPAVAPDTAFKVAVDGIREDDVNPNIVTPARARMLALHAIHVQGGVSDPDREKARAEAQLAQSPGSIDWQKMQHELLDATLAKAEAALPSVEVPDTADASVLNIDKIRTYQRLRAEEDRLTAEGKAMKEEADRLEQELVEMFSEAGLQNLNVDGKTVYLGRKTFAQWKSGMDPEEKRAALRAAGHDELISETINANTLAAFVRELVDEGGPGMPPELADLLELGESYRIGINAAGSRSKAKTRSK